MRSGLLKRRSIAGVAVIVTVAQVTATWAQVQVRPVEGGVIISPSTSPASRASPATAPPPAGAAFKQEELEQIVAPLALYPDSLLSQILMASTYPVELVQAERWAKQNKALKGDALGKALEAQTWDPSVKSLVNFPEVLTMMSEKLDWTVKLGDAFIGQQKQVMDTVQALRAKAQAAGNLASNSQQNVTVQAVSATQPGATGATQIITIESANPQVVYVPTYNPTVVYGGWPYPSYPPYSYYPPSYAPGAAAVSFGVGLAIGAAWGYAWGGCNWHGGDVDVDIDRNVNINSNIDREKYKAERDARQTDRQGNRTERQGSRDGSRAGGASTFQHDPSHRQGVAYRDQGTAQRFGGASSNQAQARDSYRGRAEAGRADIARGGADSYRSSAGVSDRSSYGGSGGSARGDYRASSSVDRASQSGTRSGAFNDAGSSGRATQSYSNRGQTSRSSSGGGYGSSGGGSRSAPARSSGGGGRAGGGGGSRGGGGGRR